MHPPWLYRTLSRLPRLSYRGKIMLVAFAGTHVPLLAVIAWYAAATTSTPGVALAALATVLAGTLAGTATTVLALDQLLQPVLVTASGLRGYVERRILPALPATFTDEAGTLMADVAFALTRLDAARDRLASHDPVTGLAERDLFIRDVAARLAAPGSSDVRCAIVAFRLADLTRVSATFGQDAADACLRTVARRLEGASERIAGLARVDADVLAAVVERPADPEALAAEVRAISEAANLRIAHDAAQLQPDVRAGIALCPADGERPDVLLDHAVAAITAQPEDFPTPVAFFSAEAREAERQRFLLERELREALARDQLHLHYQPVVDVRARRVAGAEALIRWQHPELGAIPPLTFLAIAEQNGMIDEIGRWVVRTACRQAKTWRAEGLEGLRLAVNLCAREFRDPSLVRWIDDVLTGAGLARGTLEVELTETAAMIDPAYSQRTFSTLREMGVSVALDDFGTGYASVSQLRTLPFDRLKIDREFVRGLAENAGRRAICQALVELSRGLAVEAVAEGTETLADVWELHRRGCHVFQGYVFAPPLPPAEFAQRVRELSWLEKRLVSEAA